MIEPPRAAYRVQLGPAFGFRRAAEIAGYLHDLGVSHLYTSPLMQAAPGSTHGYDVVDPQRVSEELGGTEGFRELVTELEAHDLGQVLDLVPNHMAASGPENPWWWDVLENGPSSRHASWFDIDWGEPEDDSRAADGSPPRPRSDALLLPMLGSHYGRVLEDGGLRIRRSAEHFLVEAEGTLLPASPRSVGELLRTAMVERQGRQTELGFVADALAELPSASSIRPDAVARRHRDRRVLTTQLRRLLAGDPANRAAVDRAVEAVNGDVERLDRFMALQNYRLASWRLATEEIGYRRFFHINELVALRAGDPEVFRATHRRPLEWIGMEILDGLRVDHPDGLRDPAAYFRSLREAAPRAWIVAEKILEPEENLPVEWPIDGTTGYEFLNLLAGIQIDGEREEEWSAAYASFTGEETVYRKVARNCRLRACTDLLGSDLNRIGELFRRVAERHRRHRDHARADLQDALMETAASFPVYRTYVRAEEGEISDQDRGIIEEAIAGAARHRPDLDPDPLRFLEDLLLLRITGPLESELVMRFQQFTGPVAAKGVEDTAFYRYNRFVALNEVGGDPSRFGVPVEEFHRVCARTQELRPRTLLTTSTHDTKRSEDVRARLHALSEIPQRWAEAVERWSAMVPVPDALDRNTEYLCYQTLVGAWPIGEARLTAYLEKAAREAGVHTLWTDPDEAFEDAIRTFVHTILADEAFVAALESFVEDLVEPGRINALAQTLIRLTAPGVPDLYQGCELWDLSLVDPDNRRPVDFEGRRALLSELDALPPEALLARGDEGLPKLHVVREALHLRRDRPAAFGAGGGYRPLEAAGPAARHVVAFCRGERVATVVPRLPLGLGGRWGDTSIDLPEGSWGDRLTGGVHDGGRARMADLLGRFPVALLVREEGP